MTHIAKLSGIPTYRLISQQELFKLALMNERSIMSHPDFRTRVHSERPGWYVPYARGGDTEIKFANDKLKSVSISDDSLDNSVNSDQQTTSNQWTSDHSLSRQEAKLQLRQAGKGSERSTDERNENPRRDSPDHQALTGQPNTPGHDGWSTINQSPGLATKPKEAASSKQATATVGLRKESTGSPGLTVHPAKTAEEEWSWPIGALH